MSNKVKRLGRHQTISDDATVRLAPLTCVGADDANSLLGEGDVQWSLVRISCHCGAPVAVLWSNDRRARTGKPAFLFLQAQIIEEQATRPVKTRIVEDVVEPGKSFPADCPAHGRHIIDGASLIEHGRAMQARIARGGEQMAARIARGEERSGKYILPRVSRPPE
jgi:hypothetical protein